MTDENIRPRALVIAPAFFGYEKDIVAEFERQGYATTFIDERPSTSTVALAALRVRKGLIGRLINKYYRRKWSTLASSAFEIVLVVKGEATPRWFLENLRKSNAGAHFVFYSYDALANLSSCETILDCFDELLSFDRDDVAARPDFDYLPLFYTKEFELPADGTPIRPRRYRLSFVGTLHTERYAFAKRLFVGRTGVFGFFYSQARWYFAVSKYITREHISVPWADVSFQKLDRERVADIFRNSVAVLDMPRRGQAGLTMRTFEVLASGAVLVTTNAAITSEPFFDPAWVVVVPSDLDDVKSNDLQASLDAIAIPPGPPPAFDRYSLESWVRAIVTAPRAGKGGS